MPSSQFFPTTTQSPARNRFLELLLFMTVYELLATTNFFSLLLERIFSFDARWIRCRDVIVSMPECLEAKGGGEEGRLKCENNSWKNGGLLLILR